MFTGVQLIRTRKKYGQWTVKFTDCERYPVCLEKSQEWINWDCRRCAFHEPNHKSVTSFRMLTLESGEDEQRAPRLRIADRLMPIIGILPTLTYKEIAEAINVKECSVRKRMQIMGLKAKNSKP